MTSRVVSAGLVVALAVAFTAGCASAKAVEPPPASPPDVPETAPDDRAPSGPGIVQVGEASYYADSLAGHPTASGEPYDPGALTAAHRTLPLGTVVEVERDDGRKVEVRINDRGPFGKEDRILDLSRHAAETLGIVRSGVAKVKMTVVKLAPAKPKKKRHHRRKHR